MKSLGICCVLAAAGSVAFTLLLLRGYGEPSAVLVSAAGRAVDSTTAPAVSHEQVLFKCGLTAPCPPGHFSFKVASGAANVLASKICWEDAIVTMPALSEMQGGLSVVLINGMNGEIMDRRIFNLYSGDPEECLRLLRAIEEKTIVVVASFDDVATCMDSEIRDILSELGSTQSKSLRFRDSWVFLGAKGVNGQSPFEQLVENNMRNNAYAGWPARAEVAGCVPQFRP
ncbi:protein FAM3A-like isoform X2 [Petromyzon marinus]|uniref:Protein FAM3A-like n=1 Tax=Petromyzon marinus TaxID=7757 RepID=A0AAJ7U0N7_PETMA|nr:protein FAM3A-like [Petromyzon marinus]